MTPVTHPDMVSLNDFCAQLGVARTTGAELIASGRGPGLKVGRRYIIRRQWVEAWLDGRHGFWSVAEPPVPTTAQVEA